MYPSLFFGIWVLNEIQFGFGGQIFDFGQLDEIVNSFALVLKMEARVLKRLWKFNDRLTDIVNLLLCGNLLELRLCTFSRFALVTYHDLDLLRPVWKIDSQVEESCRLC